MQYVGPDCPECGHKTIVDSGRKRLYLQCCSCGYREDSSGAPLPMAKDREERVRWLYEDVEQENG